MGRGLRGAALIVGILAAGCQPRFVESSAEVDRFLSRMDYAAACVGLKSNDESLRTYTARKLAEYADNDTAKDCLCEAVYDAEAHTFDPLVAEGFTGSRDDGLAACLLPATEDAALKDRMAAFEAYGATLAPSAHATLATIVASGSDPALRAAAAKGLAASAEHEEVLATALKSDTDATVREAAAKALSGRRTPASRDRMIAALKSDEDRNVRAAAVANLADNRDALTDKALCVALMDDESPTVRAGAATALKGEKRADVVQCLRKRLLTKEDSPEVRTAVMDALGASPSKGAADALCEAIGPVLRMYVKDTFYDEYEGVDIVAHQNDRDYERSYECVTKALSQGGYSCYARHHLGLWVNELGGNGRLPQCPGMTKR